MALSLFVRIALIVTALAGGAVSAERRVALVIANASYEAVPALRTPPLDAALIARSLRQAKFDSVVLVQNTSKPQLERALRDFGRAADGADVAIVYYAGHGIEVAGSNYLIPTDARLASDRDVDLEAVRVDTALDSASGAALRVIILDACRDNPFLVSMTRSAGRTRSVSRGLARIEPEGETLVAYSTKAGAVAADGDGGNSPFAAALSRRIVQPGLEISLLFRMIRDDVLKATSGAQEPYTYGSLSGVQRYFVPPSAAAAVPVQAERLQELAQAEQMAWAGAAAVNTVEIYRLYLAVYPEGPHAAQARAGIARLNAGPATQAASTAPVRPDRPAAHPTAPAARSVYTPAVATALNDATAAFKAGDLAGAADGIARAKATGLPTRDDQLATGQTEVAVFQKSSDDARTLDGIGLMLASGLTPAPMLPTLHLARAELAYKTKDYAQAAASAREAIAHGADDPQLLLIEVDALNRSGQTLTALATLNAGIDAQRTAGRTVPEEWYKRGLAIGYMAKSPVDAREIADATTEITKKWVAAYPSRTNWHDAMVTYISQYKSPTDVQVDVFRLLRATGALNGAADYTEFAGDIYLRFPGEAQAILEEGNAKGALDLAGKNAASDIAALIKAKLPADRPALAAADRVARASADGKAALSTADAYVGYAMYPEAIDLYRVALAKGADVGTVKLHLGWALILSGDRNGARAAFRQVTGARKPLADFWLIHADQRAQG